MKKTRVVLSPEAEEVYRYLSKEKDSSKTERTILTAFNNKIERIKQDPHYGDPIAKKLIPEAYRKKYGITNLFRVELPNHWRMLYTLTSDEEQVEIIAFILDIIGHKEYDKKFGYKKR